MTYDEVKQFLEDNYNKSIKIDFKEYGCISYNKPTLLLEIQGCEVITYIKGNEVITMEDVYKYYGEEALINYKDYLIYPYIRLIISEPLEHGETEEDRKLYTIHLNKAYFTSRYQEIELYVKENERGKPLSWLEQL